MTRSLLLPFFRRLLRCEHGDPIIEFILVLPLMLILGFGVMEIGRVLWYQHSITKGVRDGTRYLTRVPLVGAGACDAVTSDAETYAKDLVLNGAPWGTAKSTKITVTLEQVPNNGGTFYGPNPLCMVRMTAAVTIPFPILGTFLNTASDVTFTISNLARHIGQ